MRQQRGQDNAKQRQNEEPFAEFPEGSASGIKRSERVKARQVIGSQIGEPIRIFLGEEGDADKRHKQIGQTRRDDGSDQNLERLFHGEREIGCGIDDGFKADERPWGHGDDAEYLLDGMFSRGECRGKCGNASLMPDDRGDGDDDDRGKEEKHHANDDSDNRSFFQENQSPHDRQDGHGKQNLAEINIIAPYRIMEAELEGGPKQITSE